MAIAETGGKLAMPKGVKAKRLCRFNLRGCIVEWGFYLGSFLTNFVDGMATESEVQGLQI